ncbi:unnamed protein product [Cladocopium goreaui]|uniref:CxC5 like cysteine cluster associated with KDZ domain-containing protein n=1 Tax=Cladocopium goreaui TaxID=2562237 RepID=A0A9P1G2I6_9DINO|nr:unnamed protein product [Cladocopium goreaui]
MPSLVTSCARCGGALEDKADRSSSRLVNNLRGNDEMDNSFLIFTQAAGVLFAEFKVVPRYRSFFAVEIGLLHSITDEISHSGATFSSAVLRWVKQHPEEGQVRLLQGKDLTMLEPLSPKQFAAERFNCTRKALQVETCPSEDGLSVETWYLVRCKCPQNGIFEAPLPRKEVHADLLAEFEKGALPKKRDHGNLRTQCRWLKSARMVRQAALKRAGPCKPAHRGRASSKKEEVKNLAGGWLTSLQMAVSLLSGILTATLSCGQLVDWLELPRGEALDVVYTFVLDVIKELSARQVQVKCVGYDNACRLLAMAERCENLCSPWTNKFCNSESCEQLNAWISGRTAAALNLTGARFGVYWNALFAAHNEWLEQCSAARRRFQAGFLKRNQDKCERKSVGEVKQG